MPSSEPTVLLFLNEDGISLVISFSCLLVLQCSSGEVTFYHYEESVQGELDWQSLITLDVVL